MNVPDQRRRHGWRRQARLVAALVVGLALLETAGTVLAQDADATPPYHYVLGQAVAPGEQDPLAPLAKQDIPLRNATVVSAAGKTVADLKLAQTQAGPVLVEWNPRVAGPFLKTLPSAREVTTLAPVLARHIPAGTTLLAWWDVSREFRMMAGSDVVFGEHLGVPLFLPVRWHGERERIRTIESRFWQGSADAQARSRFKRFVHALLADPNQGVAELQALTQGKPAVLVLHVRDIVLLGQLAPDKIGVAFRDITWTGDVHGMVKGTYRWLKANDYTAYTVMKLHGTNHQVREIALMDEASANTLVARLLPLIDKNRDRSKAELPPGIRLVYKTGGFWVYELGPQQTQVTSSKDTTAEEE